MNHSVLLGSNLLRDANIKLTENISVVYNIYIVYSIIIYIVNNSVVVTKRTDEVIVPTETSKVPEIFCININETEREIDDRQ